MSAKIKQTPAYRHTSGWAKMPHCCAIRVPLRSADVIISTVPILPVRFAAARLLSPEPPAADTTGTAEADVKVFAY